MRTTVPQTPHEQVRKELELIPRGDLYQNMFRAVYQQHRLHVLGRKATERLCAAEVAERAAASVRQYEPAFRPQFAPELLDR